MANISLFFPGFETPFLVDLIKKEKDQTTYKLSHLSISKDQYQFFFTQRVTKVLLVVASLKYISSFQKEGRINPIKCDQVTIENIQLFRCSFPKRLKESFLNCAEFYGLEVSNIASKALDKKTVIKIPKHENLFYIENKKISDKEMLEEALKIIQIGESLDRLGVD